jgi:hypothetical protein
MAYADHSTVIGACTAHASTGVSGETISGLEAVHYRVPWRINQ